MAIARIALVFFIVSLIILSAQILLFFLSKLTSSSLTSEDANDYNGGRAVRRQDLDSAQTLPVITHPLPRVERYQRPNASNRLAFESAAGPDSDIEMRRRFEFRLRTQQRQDAQTSRECRRSHGSRVTSLVFVKVHKSASTTVANIVARYALRYILNVALPNKIFGAMRSNYFSARVLHQDLVPVPPGQRYEVLFNHMIFNRRDLDGVVMPSADTFYFAIARNPEDRFVSSMQYYGVAGELMKIYNLASFKQAFMMMVRGQVPFTKPELYNSLAGDTGLPAASHMDVAAIEAHVRKLERDLDLVMIVEYFDESLVLLKRKACLKMQDIVYRVKNARFLSAPPLYLNQRERAAFRNYQMADVVMYDHFYRRFWARVHAEGPDFFLEVRCLRKIQRDVADFCGSLRSMWDFVVIPRSAWNDEFMVTARDCRLMRMTEMGMQYYLMNRARHLNDLAEAGRGMSGNRSVKRENGNDETGEEMAEREGAREMDGGREMRQKDGDREMGEMEGGREMRQKDGDREMDEMDRGMEMRRKDGDREMDEMDRGREMRQKDGDREMGEMDSGREMGETEGVREVDETDGGREVREKDGDREVVEMDRGKEIQEGRQGTVTGDWEEENEAEEKAEGGGWNPAEQDEGDNSDQKEEDFTTGFWKRLRG